MSLCDGTPTGSCLFVASAFLLAIDVETSSFKLLSKCSGKRLFPMRTWVASVYSDCSPKAATLRHAAAEALGCALSSQLLLPRTNHQAEAQRRRHCLLLLAAPGGKEER